MTAHGSPRLKAIGAALIELCDHSLSIEEQELLTKIEQRRSVLLGSDKKITVIDYGAGSSGSARTQEEMRAGVRETALVATVCLSSKTAFWATFLFKLIRRLEPLSCVELGASFGISAAYQASALEMNNKGTLITLEGSPEIAKIANETMASLNLKRASVVIGPFHATLKGVLESAKPIDFFFNDGHHDHAAVTQYLNDSMPYLAPEAVIVFDDIAWSPGMKKAWLEIEDDERVAASIDLQTIGIALVGNNLQVKEKFKVPFLEIFSGRYGR